jgi:hypothetical protein
MSTIDRVSGPLGVGSSGPGAGADADSLTRSAIGQLGHRMLAWSSAIAGPDPAAGAAWSRHAGPEAGGFATDASVLARGGDVYDLRGLTAGVAADTGATPTEEGKLLRAFEGVARVAAILFHGGAGAGDGQGAGLAAALDRALAAGGPQGVDGVIARLEAITAGLSEPLGL